MRHLPGISIVAALAVLIPAAPSQTSPDGGSGGPQEAFALAARSYGVPENVLLAVSYLESRWDGNHGLPSVSGGYGPMHLVDGQAPPGPSHHVHGDPRGDETRPRRITVPDIAAVPPEDTLRRAAELTGTDPDVLREDFTANVQAGAALLADYQRRTGGLPGAGPAGWYAAVARYSGSADTSAASAFADEVYATIRSGAARVTDGGERVVLPASPGLSPARPPAMTRLGRVPGASAPDCPKDLACDWIPAAYQRTRGGDHGNHDRYNGRRQVDYIVIHDGETGYDVMTRLVKDPDYLSWHYTLRSGDGHVAQHLRTDDVGWHAGNWYFNSRSIGLEHEGYVAKGAWFTEAMYQASAKLVRYLAQRYDIPLDRAHILGHDNVPGTTPQTVRGMHQDPGPYWDWNHYFELLGRPLTGSPDSGARSVLISPDYAANQPRFTGCTKAGDCPAMSAASVWLHTRPSQSAPLVKDIGRHPHENSTYSVYDHAARASTGQRYALAGREDDWTAIWYLGQKAWFHDPADAPTSTPASGLLVTPRRGLSSVRVYGRAYPEASAYPRRVQVQRLTPLQYSLPAGQFYSLGMTTRSSYLRSMATARTSHRIVRGDARYRQIQFGHRVMFVRAADVRVVSP
ncbi:N-acetylmuramoyl-L-alanine amidase [Streptosporangium carneum]|uniref:N-acetylmuramoyl-L-alanine amidase n=1 Tax=Streptosporangium carneum TaxID=47481 RepID=A0A9W6MGM5_9ACTN|nr:peptidoglycan recognition family protein [Streptosporangium carneum]GLK13391.1 amidase [Streptosporangium carneum]